MMHTYFIYSLRFTARITNNIYPRKLFPDQVRFLLHLTRPDIWIHYVNICSGIIHFLDSVIHLQTPYVDNIFFEKTSIFRANE